MYSKQSLYTDCFRGMGASGQKTPLLSEGYATDICNFRIDSQGHLVRREGYRKLCDLPADLRGFYYGRSPASQENAAFALVGTQLFRLRDGQSEWELLCTLPMATASGEVTIFFLSERIYLLDGNDYYYWDNGGSGYVPGYVPLGFSECNPASGIGVACEAHNALSNYMRVQYSLSESGRVFVLPEVAERVAWVKVQGEYVSYQVERAFFDNNRWQINLDNVAPSGKNIVEICYALYETGARAEVLQNTRVFMYGGSDDLRVFFYGSGAAAVYYSVSLLQNTHAAEYIPLGGIIRVGTCAVTGIVRCYDHLLIQTQKETFTARQSGQQYLLYLVNADVGCQSIGYAQAIGQDTVTVSGGRIYRLVGTSREGDRVAHRIDDCVYASMPSLKEGVCCVNDKDSEVWFATQDSIFVYQYASGGWYRFDIGAVDAFFSAPDGTRGFLRKNSLYLFDEKAKDDDGSPTKAHASFAPISFGRRAPIVESAICVKGEGSARLVLKTGTSTTDQLFYACAKGALQPMQTQRVRMGAADSHTVCVKSRDRVTISFCGVRTRDGKWEGEK